MMLLASMIPAASLCQSSERIDLKLPQQKADRIATGKGMMAFGTILAVVSASALSKEDDVTGPQTGIFAVGMAAHATGLVVYTMGKRSR